MQKIEDILSESNVSVRDIKASLSSSNTLRLEVTLQVDAQTPIFDAHQIAHSVEDKIISELGKVGVKVENCSVNVEPIGAHTIKDEK